MAERVLVTGAAGFIGSHAVEALLARGCEVTGLDNFDPFYDPAIKRSNLSAALADPRFRLHEGDVCDADAVHGLVRRVRPHVLLHLAARAGVRPSIADPVLYTQVNVVGTAVVLEAARAAGVARLVVASSSSVYGNADRVPFREDDPAVHPLSPYAASKRAAELACDAAAALNQWMRIVTLRLFTVYGPRQRPDLAIHKFTRLIADGHPVPFYGDGSHSRDYTYVSDTVQGILGAVERTAVAPPGHETYNLGESATTTLTELVALVERAVGRPAILERLPPQPGDVARTHADVSRAREALGYRPRVPVEEGIPLFVDWYLRVHGGSAAASGR